FTDAINYMNANGISGSVTFNVSAGQTFNESPQTIFTQGTSVNQVIFKKSGSGTNPKFIGNNGLSNTDACFTLKGADYITFDGIDVSTVSGTASNNQQMEYGFYITMESSTNGSNHNTIKNSKITLNRSNNGTYGIFQWAFPAPSTAAQANNANKFIGNTIENSFMGIYALGTNTAGLQDDSTEVSQNIIGGNTPNDIGGGAFSSATAGIWCSLQKNAIIKNNTIRNVSTQAAVYGIFLESATGNCEISGNNINEILNSATGSSAISSGIRANLSTGTNNARIYNNFVSGVRTNFAGLNATSLSRGINLQVGGGGSNTSVFEVTHNSVYMDGYSSLGASNSCLEFAGNATTGPQIKVRSNILANFTGAQTSTAKHYCYRTASATLIGSPGSLSNNNDFYIFNSTNGFVGRGATTDHALLSNWQAAYGQDGSSISVDPVFTAPDDLHAVNSALNSTAAAASATPYITTDIDGETRTTPNSDIGADEFTPYLFDVKPTALVSPGVLGCYSSNESIGVKIMNYTGGFLDFTFNPVTVTVIINGPVTQTVSTVVNSNALNSNAPLSPFSFLTVPVGNANLSAYGSYNFTVFTSWASDQNQANDTIKNITRVNVAPSALPQVVGFTGFNGTNLNSVFTGWNEASGLTPSGTSSQWSSWNNFGTAGNVNAVITLNSNIRRDWIIGPKIIPGINSVLTFKSAITQISSATNSPASMGSDDKLYVMISIDCGLTYQKLDSIYSGSGLGNSLTQFTIPLGAYNGQPVIVGFFATDGSVIDLGGCDVHLDDINISNVTTFDFSVNQLTAPLFQTCFSNNQNIVVNLKNTGSIPIDFSSENSVLHVEISGPVLQSYNLNLNSGIITPGSMQSYTVTSNGNFVNAGAYYLTSYLTIPSGDINALNDTLKQVIYSQNPSVSFINSNLQICQNDSIQLSPIVTINGIGSATLPSFFSSGSPIPIPDNDTTGILSSIQVTSAGGFASQLVSVTIDSLLHTFAGDLVITLIAPDGSKTDLSVNNGLGGDNYISTLFTSSASTSIAIGNAPFTGLYLPQQPFTNLTGVSNGTWKLKVKDVSLNDVGTLVKWSLSFKEPNVYASHVWSSTSGFNSNTLNPIASPGISSSYELTVLDLNGCSSKDTVNISVIPVAQVNVVSPQSSLCLGDSSIQLNATPSGGYFTGNGTDSTGVFVPSVSVLGLNTITYTFVDTTGCQSSDAVGITVNDLPMVGLQFLVSQVCSQDASFQLTGATPNGGTFSGLGVQGSLFDPSDPSALGTQLISYTFTDNNGCTNQASDTMSVSLCLSEQKINSSVVTLFPNPTNGIFVINNLHLGDKIS
ncbi:MAG: proprotein convertase P-domain-containing protein, partial [Bacteroidota bacterium]